MGAWVPELATCWRQSNGQSLSVDLTDVGYVDEAGRQLMTNMYRAGVRFVARGFVIPELLREIEDAVDGNQRNPSCAK